MVLREPQRFGTITKTRGDYPTHFRLNRIPTALTATEKEHMFHCERNGKTRGARYQDVRQPAMTRCPFIECGHSVINLRAVPGSIGAHFREYHLTQHEKFCIHFSHKGKPGIVRLPEDKENEGQPTVKMADKKQQQEKEDAPKVGEGNPEPPKRRRLRGCDTRNTQPKILDAMLRIRRQQEERNA